jgi:chemotaxis protein methyltransferase CheR
MYFTKEWVNKISQDLFNCLSEDGWFVVSSCELSSQVFPQFTPVNFPGAVLYRKGKNGSAYSHNIHSDEIPELLFGKAFLTTEASLTTKASPKIVAKEIAKVVAKEVEKEDPQSIVKTPEEFYTDKIFAIRLLANLGHLEEALSLCDEAIASYKLSSGLYFLRASILQELDKSSEAIASLKQAIYIDPDYIMGHFALGNLFFRQGNTKNAERYFNNVLDLLSRCANDDILPESEGLSVKYIREIIIANMQTQLTK